MANLIKTVEADFKARGQRGGIVGSAWLVGVIPPCAMGPSLFTADCSHKWHSPEQWGFVLEGVRPLPFVQWTGERGFFEVPDDYVERAAQGESGKKPRRVWSE